jgi:uncharacterized membrane protein YfcA
MLESIALALIAAVTAFINGALGGGYGTISGPVLLLLGYPPHVAIPAILFSEAVGEYWSGAWHMKFHNVNIRVFLLTTLGGALGILAAVLVIGVFLSATLTRFYIGVMAVFMGVFVILKSIRKKASPRPEKQKIHKWKIIALGFVCGFNKSSTGGGYGPISTTGYMLLGMPAALAVGTTILAKATGCVLSILSWAALRGMDWTLTLPMSAGAFVGAPIAALLNNYFKANISPLYHERLVGLIMTLLGAYSLVKQFGLV